ncbi:amino acid ABC transporter substrate-binding protein/permease [Leucobacter sp. gxy201]|uniref:amino acid ABC transporter substrate-binding protein/permease n=1 Tax=Leucobacter sp. gxy201 TaxID=2957200 RepID=UPI003DA17430
MHQRTQSFGLRLAIGAALTGLFLLVAGGAAQAVPQTPPSAAVAAVPDRAVAPGPAKAADLGGKKFVIATDTTFAPFEFREGGELVGIDMDLLNRIAEEENFTVDIQSLGFQAAVSAVTSGQADGVIAGMSITDERKQTFDFSDPYFDSGIQMAVADDSDITGYEDLQGQTVVAKGGSEGESEAKKLSEKYGFTVKALDQSTSLIESVKNGSAAAVFDDYPVLKYGIAQGNGLKVVTDKIPGGQYGFAVAKGQNADLLEAFDEGLAELKADGTYDEILAQYLGDAGGSDAAQSEAPEALDLGGKQFTIATDTTFAPFEFREGGELVGIDMDLLNRIAEEENFTVDIQSLGFQAAVSAVTSGQADGVIAGMSITDERKQTFDFSDPYFDSGIQMAVADDSDITGYEDLQGQTVVAKGGSEGESEAKKLSEKYGFTVKALDQSTSLIESVKNGSAAAVFDDYPVLKYGIAQGNGLKVVTDKIPGGQYGFAVAKGQNADLLEAFDNGLARLKADGTYDQILAQYLGEDTSASGTAAPTEKSSFFQLLVDSMPALGQGLWNTVRITVTSFVIALALGLAFGFMKISSSRILRGIASTFVAIFRGTPVLVWAFLFYFGLPQLTGMKGDIFWAGVATLALNAGAYLTEIVRGGLQAVDPGQMEAARSLGLGWGKSMQRVVVPQAVKISTPAIINQFVITLKDSSLLLTIGFAELLYQAQQIYAANYRTTEMLIIVGIMYFVVITLLTWVANIVDKKVNK